MAKVRKVEGSFGCSFSLPQQLAKDISYVSRAIGVSQSSLLAEMLGQPMSDLRGLIEQAGAPGVDHLAVMRLRGASAKVVATRVREALAKLEGDS